MNAEIGPPGGNGRPEGTARAYGTPVPRSDMPRPFEPRSSVGTSPLRDYASTLRRWRGTVALVTILMVVLAAAYSYTRTPVYTATASVLVRPVQTSSEPARVSDIDATTEMKIATSLAVAKLAAVDLGVRDPRTLTGHVSASMTEGSQILTITFGAGGPNNARDGAQAFATDYLNYRGKLTTDAIAQQQASILTRLKATRERIVETKASLAQAAAGSANESNLRGLLELLTATELNLQTQLGAFPATGVDPGIVIDPANLPTSPSSPNHPFDVAAGLFVGLALGAALAFVRDQMQRRIDSPDDVEDVLGVPALATVPRLGLLGRRRSSGLAVDRDSTGSMAHAYRSLRTSLLAARERNGIRTVLVTSAGAGEGKTTTAANLAAALAEVGAQVVLISADLRKPSLHKIFGLPEKPGLTEVLANGAKLGRAMRKTSIKNLRVVPSGSVARTTDAANLLESPRMAAILREVGDVDWVIIDAPPVLGPTDALILTDLADAVLVVIDGGATRERNAVAACRHIVRAGGQILGVVVNKAEGFNQYQYDYPSRPWFASRKDRGSRSDRSRSDRASRRSPAGQRPGAPATTAAPGDER
jgi:capsular exopolysaccharide synthesis family protein